jgi:hypothetical protein
MLGKNIIVEKLEYVFTLLEKDLSTTEKPYGTSNHDVLGYVMELIIKNFSMNRGVMTWFRVFGVIMRNLLIIEPFFH